MSQCCRCCLLALVVGNGSSVGLSGIICRCVYGERGTLSCVCGMVAGGGVYPVAADAISGSIFVFKQRVLPTVGNFSDIMPSALQVFWLKKSLSASLVTYSRQFANL